MTTQSTIVSLEAIQLAALMKVLPVPQDQLEHFMSQGDCIDVIADGRFQGTIGIQKLDPDYLSKLRTAAAESGELNGRYGIYLTAGGKTSFIGYEHLEAISRV